MTYIQGGKSETSSTSKIFWSTTEVRMKYEWSTSEVRVKYREVRVKYALLKSRFSPLGIIVGFSDSINHEETRKITDQSIAFKYFFYPELFSLLN